MNIEYYYLAVNSKMLNFPECAIDAELPRSQPAQAHNRASDAARSSGQAAARASDSHTGVDQHHPTPPKVSESGVSDVSMSSGQDIADASKPCDIPDWLVLWFLGLENPIRLLRTPLVTNRCGKGLRYKYHHNPPRERGKGLPAKFQPSCPNLDADPDPD
eukprot:6193353-Pleurochrysis_carterae.AAC.6